MSSRQHHVLLLGDQTDNVTTCIIDLYRASKRSGLLARFLSDASDVCKNEFGSLQPCFRKETPRFESLLDMAENHAKTDGSPVLASCAVSYFARLGQLVLRAEHDPTILSSPRVLIGLCINIFPAALAATARSATELAQLSLEGFPSYLNTIIANHTRTKQIEQVHGSWSCMVSTQSETDLQSLLDKFHDELDIPNHKRTWIGVIGSSWVTVSGPPSTLELLKAECPEFRNLSPVTLPVASAVHAPHLPAFEFKSTARPSYIWDYPIQEGACIMATDDCVPYTARTLGEVAQRIIPAVLRTPLKIQGTFTATAKYLKKLGSTAAISVIGPSAQAASLIQTLKYAGVSVTVLPVPDNVRNTAQRDGTGAVAIVGMSARLPQANDLVEFWQLLLEGRTTHKRIPSDRFNLDDFYDPTGAKKNSMMSTDGCFLSDPGGFDARLFNMSPREAIHVDPTHRLLLMASHEALERAGHNPEAGPSRNTRTAVYFGQNADVWREANAEQGVDTFTAPGILRAFSPGRVSNYFGFQGATYSVDSACSSSATAIQLACDALIHRKCDMALAGGAQIASSPFEFCALGRSGFLSQCGGCKTFRADADGYCRGEGVGVIVLKRLEDALADNDNIEAVITGWGRNSSGASSITHPHSEAQEKLIRQVLRQTYASPDQIGYVECHGTGTIVGDLAEMISITNVFGKHFTRDVPIHVGSLKANVGHSESAAGVSSVVKAALMLKKGVIPPQAGIAPETRLHPGFADLDVSPICIASQPDRIYKEKILVNNFDAAGGNTCLLIESAPKPDERPPELDSRTWHLVTVSAQTDESLQSNRNNLMKYLVNHPNSKPSDVAYSTTRRKMTYPLRSAYAIQSTRDLIDQLENDIAHPDRNVATVTGKPKVIFMFNGQGSHFFCIARELYNTHPAFHKSLDSLQGMCQELYPQMRRTIINILADEGTHIDGSFVVEEQLAIVCVQLALADLWRSWGVQPDMVLGHSIGEYAALSVAGVLSVADTLWLVAKRAELLDETYTAGEYGMLSLSATADDVLALLNDHGLQDSCDLACFNSDTSHVVGGLTTELLKLEMYAKSKDIATQSLAMGYAGHCRIMERICEPLRKIARKVSFFAPRIPVCSSVTGEITSHEGRFTADHIVLHARQPVRFSDSLKRIEAIFKNEPVSPAWIDIGPNSTCLTMLRQTLNVSPSHLLPSLCKSESNWKTLTTSAGKAYAAGVKIDWSEFHRPFVPMLKLLDLPTYAFTLKTFWQPYTLATACAAGIDMSGRTQQEHEFTPTAAVQRIRNQKIGTERIEVTFISSLADLRLRDAIEGHRIEGSCVCPASVYVDMAVTAAAYIHGIVRPNKMELVRSLECLQLQIPFVLRGDSRHQTMEIRVTAEKKTEWNANISFHSEAGDHGSCQVPLTASVIGTGVKGKDVMQQACLRCANIINTEGDSQPHIDHLHRRMFYKLYDTVVKYSNRYQGIVEVWSPEMPDDADAQEIGAEVKLSEIPDVERGAYMLSPYHSDALVHVGGFMLNIKLSEAEADTLYFSSGIGSITLFAELSADKTYRSYCSLSGMLGGKPVADVYIFTENEIVGFVAGLKFQRMKKAALKALLHGTQRAQPSPTIAPAQRPTYPLNSDAHGAALRGLPLSSNGQDNMADSFISALIEESGVDPDDLKDSASLSELGVDSLMGIAIIQKMKSSTGHTLPISMISELQTIRDVRDRLGSLNSEATSQSCDTNAVSISDSIVTSSPQDHSPSCTPPPDSSAPAEAPTTLPKSNAVLLHGKAHSSLRPLFLIAGSTGSASGYTHLPPLSSGTPIWALESPFLDNPTQHTYTPAQLAPSYVAALKSIQPSGPYLLGGYSGGAVHAYETARALLDAGEGVDKLILIDMKAHLPGSTWAAPPVKEDLSALREALLAEGDTHHHSHPLLRTPEIDALESERLFAGLRCVYAWKPVPMPPDRRPKHGTLMIWARRGVRQDACGEVNPMGAENTDYKLWFCGARREFGANGWDGLVGGDLRTCVVEGDHWNILQMPCAAEVSKLIDQAITNLFEG
ncbi:hypothetical protein F5Y08DRAFT_351317 [Xylaria arbuscula]|nr:hypothetical protein F5Y08DRAFT_351317 [Xylaria arbuscula]